MMRQTPCRLSAEQREAVGTVGDVFEVKYTQIAQRILQRSRSELYVSMRYMDLAFSRLKVTMTTELSMAAGTDGRFFAVNVLKLLPLYEQDRRLVNRLYLHTILHCLMEHLFKKPRENETLWHLSCDIAVESIMDGMSYRCLRTGISRLRMNTYQQLHEKLKVLTAEGIYRTLEKDPPSMFELSRLQLEFGMDDHSLWPRHDAERPGPQPEIEQLRKDWQEVSEKTQTEMETFASDASDGSGDLHQQMKAQSRQRYDYASFLRRFAVLREEMGVDPDTFDYVFYSYGLSLYGNLPLIEPQETREVRKIEEFVIVIDVSMSTSGDLVKAFLEQTYRVLTEQESYLRKVHIRILQCDTRVVSDQKITSKEELDSLMEHFTLEGGGGTDFRPAFAYVQQLIDRKELEQLQGMLYFTDGKGIYPSRKTPWKTAFVFLAEDYSDVSVPPWAIKLILPREDLEKEKKKMSRLRTDHHFLWDEDQS